jgi:hypothetical protein
MQAMKWIQVPNATVLRGSARDDDEAKPSQVRANLKTGELSNSLRSRGKGATALGSRSRYEGLTQTLSSARSWLKRTSTGSPTPTACASSGGRGPLDPSWGRPNWSSYRYRTMH